MALLLLPLCLAAGPAAMGTTAGIAASPRAILEASLRGYAADGSACGPGRIVGTAAQAHLENDTNEFALGISPVGTPSHSASDHAGAAVTIELRDLCRVILLPIAGGTTVRGAATHLAPRDGPPTDHAPRGSTTRPPLRLDPTLSLDARLDGAFRLEGDVRLALWEADVTVQGADGATTIHAGKHSDRPPAPLPDVAAGRMTQTEAYLDLYGANLTAVGLGPSLLLNFAALRADDGFLLLDQAALQVAGKAVAGGQVRLGAPAALEARRDASKLHVQVGHAATLDVDGNRVTQPGGGASAGTLGVLLVGLAGGSLLLGTWGVKRATRRLAGTDRYARTVAMARWVAWLPLLGRHERVILVVALLKLERYPEAEQALARKRRWHAILPTWDFLMAHLRARTGDRAGAVRHLTACISIDPSYATDARADPALRPIVDEARHLAHGSRPEGYA
ncbi:MAG TPA: hypothetical protein VM241_06070 [Candidatus Thermoplasmatota archaeon]|nr:hypothetical protein [Candidatus Thermoplasmatota archaeon]